MLKRTLFISAVLVLSWSQAVFVSSAADVNKANKLYQEEKYNEALKVYKDALEDEPESGLINYNLGTAYYKAGQFNQSLQHLQKALLTEDTALKQNAYYNLGNASYKTGIAKEREDIGFAILSLEKALKHYEEAISLDETDEDAQHNYEFVKQEIERLKQQQQQQQSEQPQESQDQPQDQNQDQQQDQQQNQQQNQQQDQEQEQQDQQENQQQDQQQPSDQQNQESESEESQDNQSDQESSSDSSESDQQQEQEGQDQEEEEDSENEQEESSEENSHTGDENTDESDYNNDMQAGAQNMDATELSQEEAEMLLRGFEQTEEPQELLNVFKGKVDTTPVSKDW